MQEINTLSELAERFNNIEGIEAHENTYDGERIVKVMDESAIGDFFKVCREHDVTRRQTTRGDIPDTVMDSYVSLD